tara:strand:+ start:830 stop:1708 length:879 start_codon:yes stop_codon:yes gene_type:complete
MFLKKLKDNIVNIDNKYFKSSIINLYLKLKYFFKIRQIYVSIEKTSFEKKKKHNLNKELIVSLTSYSKRFRTLPLVLDCLQNQTILPDKIELWIEENDKSLLPKKIYNFKGVDIKFCENGLYSYKKIIPTLKEGDDRFIVTFDDDILYPLNSLEALVTKSKEFPNDIIANRLHEIKLKNTLPDIYINWQKNCMSENDLSFFTSGGGALFPPNCFYKDILNKKIFMEICPSADDIWLNWMAKLNNKKIRYSGIDKKYTLIKIIKSGLYKKNVKQNFNDVQIKRIIKKYGFPYN